MAQRVQKHIIRWAGVMILGALWPGMSAAQTPAQGSSGAQSGIKRIDIPDGGHIFLGALAGQPTPEDALGKVLHQLSILCGDHPQLGKLVKNPTGEILAGFFTVTGKNQDGKPMAGLALVYAPKSGTAGGAVLMDNADRFPSTVNSMFARLKQELGKAPAASSSGAQASADGSGASSKAAAPMKATPPQPLQRAVRAARARRRPACARLDGERGRADAGAAGSGRGRDHD